MRRAAHPLRGFSGLISTAALGASCVSSVCSLSARVLNAPHDLHASITTRDPPFAAAFGFFAAGAAVVALRFGAISSQVPTIFAESGGPPQQQEARERRFISTKSVRVLSRAELSLTRTFPAVPLIKYESLSRDSEQTTQID